MHFYIALIALFTDLEAFMKNVFVFTGLYFSFRLEFFDLLYTTFLLFCNFLFLPLFSASLLSVCLFVMFILSHLAQACQFCPNSIFVPALYG